MLEATSGWHNGEIDQEKKLEGDGDTEPNDGKMTALYEGYTIYCAVNDKYGLKCEEVFVEFGDDPQKVVNFVLQELVKEASQAGLSLSGAGKLEKILCRHEKVFWLRLGSGESAAIQPEKIDLDPSKPPRSSKSRQYSAEKRRFLSEDLEQLVHFKMDVPSTHVFWQATPYLVPMKSDAKFRTTIDLRPVTEATKTYNWPMPNNKLKMSDVKGRKYILSLNFWAVYWQCLCIPVCMTRAVL